LTNAQRDQRLFHCSQVEKAGSVLLIQDGSHIRLTTQLDGEFHVTVPEHHPIKIGTFKSILKLIAAHHGLTIGGQVLRSWISFTITGVMRAYKGTKAKLGNP
jgi:predicted RNA binding protein YcfA (HicA-like mRNA interferase family)